MLTSLFLLGVKGLLPTPAVLSITVIKMGRIIVAAIPIIFLGCVLGGVALLLLLVPVMGWLSS